MLSLASVVACDWGTYGNTYTPLWNSQISPLQCFSQFGTTPITLSLAQGMTAGTQPLIVNFQTKAFLFFNNGNYLQVYDENLILQQEALTGIALTNLDSLDFNNDGIYELANFYTYNSTLYTLKVYSYTPSTNILSMIYSYNITTSVTPTLTGLRHSGQNIYSVNSSTLLKINQTNFVATPILATPTAYTEPLSTYVDYNGDGVRDFMTYSIRKLIIFDENGVVILTIDYPNIVGGANLRSARMINPTGTSLWKLATLVDNGISMANPSLTLDLYNLDGSSYWSKTIKAGGSSSIRFYGDMAVSIDYNGNLLPDIYVTGYMTYTLNPETEMLRIYSGNDGNLLFSNNITFGTLGVTSHKLTIADMNHDTKDDFVYNMQGNLSVYDAQNNQILFNYNGVPSGYCIPADLNFDGNLDVICSASGDTKLFTSNYTNQNAVITSVIYDPSTAFAVNTNLNMIISATDFEGNSPLYYRHKCFASDNWSVENTNPSQSCYYNSIGTFENSIGVRDLYHSDYVTFAQTIYVSETGTLCGNDICEIGENSVNCPADCISNVTQTQATETGGMPLPTKIVDVNNVEQGLLPEIYYGILGFLSNTLTPMIILVFTIFFVLIMLAIAFIIRRIAHRVGDLAH
jgi:hypothetical protein